MSMETQEDPTPTPAPFELKPWDALAPTAIAKWIEHALRLNVVGYAEDTKKLEELIPPAKIAGAARRLADILDYQDANGARMPD